MGMQKMGVFSLFLKNKQIVKAFLGFLLLLVGGGFCIQNFWPAQASIRLRGTVPTPYLFNRLLVWQNHVLYFTHQEPQIGVLFPNQTHQILDVRDWVPATIADATVEDAIVSSDFSRGYLVLSKQITRGGPFEPGLCQLQAGPNKLTCRWVQENALDPWTYTVLQNDTLVSHLSGSRVKLSAPSIAWLKVLEQKRALRQTPDPYLQLRFSPSLKQVLLQETCSDVWYPCVQMYALNARGDYQLRYTLTATMWITHLRWALDSSYGVVQYRNPKDPELGVQTAILWPDLKKNLYQTDLDPDSDLIGLPEQILSRRRSESAKSPLAGPLWSYAVGTQTWRQTGFKEITALGPGGSSGQWVLAVPDPPHSHPIPQVQILLTDQFLARPSRH